MSTLDYYGCISESGQHPYRQCDRQNNGKARILVSFIFTLRACPTV